MTQEITFMADKIVHPELPQVTVQFVYVTPAVAKEWLAVNDRNRNKRDPHAAGLARDMEAKEFLFTGDTIKFSYDGILLDGQHRLDAIVKSGEAQWMLVVFGLGYESQDAMDRGAGRVFADALQMRQESYATLLAAAARRAYLWQAGAYTFSTNIKPTQRELDRFLRENEELRRSVSVAAAPSRKAPVTGSLLALAHWLFSHLDADQADWFIQRLADRDGIPAKHPIATLHDKLTGQSAPKYQRGYIHYNDGEVMYLIIMAWNRYRKGKTSAVLKFPEGGLTTANMPMPQ